MANGPIANDSLITYNETRSIDVGVYLYFLRAVSLDAVFSVRFKADIHGFQSGINLY